MDKLINHIADEFQKECHQHANRSTFVIPQGVEPEMVPEYSTFEDVKSTFLNKLNLETLLNGFEETYNTLIEYSTKFKNADYNVGYVRQEPQEKYLLLKENLRIQVQPNSTLDLALRKIVSFDNVKISSFPSFRYRETSFNSVTRKFDSMGEIIQTIEDNPNTMYCLYNITEPPVPITDENNNVVNAIFLRYAETEND